MCSLCDIIQCTCVCALSVYRVCLCVFFDVVVVCVLLLAPANVSVLIVVFCSSRRAGDAATTTSSIEHVALFTNENQITQSDRIFVYSVCFAPQLKVHAAICLCSCSPYLSFFFFCTCCCYVVVVSGCNLNVYICVRDCLFLCSPCISYSQRAPRWPYLI